MEYDLSHLTQRPEQDLLGPVADDEALLLYAICRVICARVVIEFGGMNGYSAMNFLRAVGREGTVYSVDKNVMPCHGFNHRVIRKHVKEVAPEDFDHMPADLLFIDCHSYEETMIALRYLKGVVVTERTLIALHDTGTHPEKIVPDSTEADTGEGWVHCHEERDIADELCEQYGYSRVSFHAPTPTPPIRYRHGLSFLAISRSFGG